MTGRIKEKQCYSVIHQSKDLERIRMRQCHTATCSQSSELQGGGVFQCMFILRGLHHYDNLAAILVKYKYKCIATVSHNVPKSLDMYTFL